jgi:hypothetical protein
MPGRPTGRTPHAGTPYRTPSRREFSPWGGVSPQPYRTYSPCRDALPDALPEGVLPVGGGVPPALKVRRVELGLFPGSTRH